MKILHVTQAFYPFQEKGGPAFKVRALAAGLARHGHGVTVLTADLGLKKHSEFYAQLRSCKFGWKCDLDGIEVLYLSTRASYHALTINPDVLRFSKSALAEFDTVHCYGLYDLLTPVIGHFCRHRGIAYVVEPMGMYRPIDRSLHLKFVWHRMFGKTLLRGAAKIIATSELERHELLDSGFPPDKVVLRYNGVDTESFSCMPPSGLFRTKWNLPPQEPLILFISRLIPRKGADLLIRAFGKVCQQRGRLVIAGPEGEAGYQTRLEKIARESGAGERIIFCGPLYEEEKKAAFTDSDIFVLPSRYENFANVVAEAMASGVPVIVSDACGISPLIEGQAGMVIPPREDALIEALRKLIYDQRFYAQLKNGCRRVVDQLDWSTLTKQMETYYGEAISSKLHSAR